MGKRGSKSLQVRLGQQSAGAVTATAAKHSAEPVHFT